MTTDPKAMAPGADGRAPAGLGGAGGPDPAPDPPPPAAAAEESRPPAPATDRPPGEGAVEERPLPGDVAPGTEAPEAAEAAEAAELVDDSPVSETATSAEAGGAGEPDSALAAAEPDYKDLYLRAVAETDNVRKRARRDVAAAEARGLARLARELLPALDNLDRALAHAEAEEQDEEHHLTKGIRLVQADLVAALARLGIESYSPKGERFDPHHHEAVAQQAVEGAESGTIVEVYQPGYRYGGEILRAAKVVVAT
jgi:molecular chaperone GrpE